ncbi:MAG: hypothetical protein H6506_05055 [Calditrichaeota bacterium]|nr:hypothetical protein [Calditrichota bacterium]MCB9366366.1 hypothetical protein [Calditrichota bacterium]MCB9392004.1 hypothetical protein [Calditrichota bacterium]
MYRTFLAILAFVISVLPALAGVAHTSARIYKKQGEIAKSMEFFDQAATEEPDNLDVFFERGELLGMIAMDDAQIALRKKLAGDSENPQRTVLEMMVRDFDRVRRSGDDKKAKKLLKKMDSQIEEYWWSFYGKAVGADSSYRAVMDSFRVMDRPAFADLLNLNDATKAEFLSSDQAADSILALYTDRVLNNGIDAANVSIMLDPKHWSSRFVYAQLVGFKNKDETYITAWRDALTALRNSEIKSEDAEGYKNNIEYAHLQLIQFFYAHEDFERTLEIADEMLKEDPKSIDAVQYKAFALATMAGDETLSETSRDSLKRVALTALESAKSSNPEDENIIYYIGQFNLQLKDTASALGAFDEFLSKVPDDAIVLALEGLIYLEGDKFGDLKLAIERFRAAKEADPDNAAYWTNYGIALLRDNQNDEGLKAMEMGEKLAGH